MDDDDEEDSKLARTIIGIVVTKGMFRARFLHFGDALLKIAKFGDDVVNEAPFYSAVQKRFRRRDNGVGKIRRSSAVRGLDPPDSEGIQGARDIILARNRREHD